MTGLKTREGRGADLTVFERFEAIANAYPDNLAYASGVVGMKYSDLAAHARTARARILAAGPSTPQFVAILTADRLNALIGILGAAASGHAYVLLDVNDPDKRLAHIAREVGPFAILADEALLGRAEGLAGGQAALINLDDRAPEGGDARLTEVRVTPDSLLYVSFTSGSTGVPKGVCQTHRNLMFHVDAYIEAMEIRAGDRISWLFAHGASASNMDIYGALFTGARLCAFEVKEQSFAAMARWIDYRRIALLHTVPTVVRELVRSIGEDKVFESVRVVDLAGEMLFANDVARMRPHFPPGCRILNRLAATEASFISSLLVTEKHEKADGALPVGKPPSGVEVAILRSDGGQASAGEAGVIAIDSPYVSTGYLSRPELNSIAFSALDGRPGWRRFKSEDLGFLDKEGDLHFIGRSGSRIKLRGQAVDLAEVEAALYQCPGVTGAVVLPRGEPGAEAREVLAYLTVADEAAQEPGEIRKQLAQALPAYMLPSGYVFLREFPHTATSKVDRNALAALDLDQVRFRPGYAPPEDEFEEKVAAIFSDVLGLRSVGRLDDFFLLGGDSLALVNLQMLVTETFGQQLPQLHADATVKRLAEWLRESEKREIDAPIVVPIRTEGSAPPLFVVHGRRGLALVSPRFLELLGDEQPLYALQARGLDGKQEPHRTIDAMAAEYVAAIRAVQPEGPYFIGGFCAGCYVAIEMVRQLYREGELCYAPLLIDPPSPRLRAAHEDLAEQILLWQLRQRAKSGDWKIDLDNGRAVVAAKKVARAFEEALRAYTPRIPTVRVMVIATLDRWRNIQGLKRLFGQQAHIFLIEGDHREMLSPENRDFAAAVRKCLAHVADLAELYRTKLAPGAQTKSRRGKVRASVAAEDDAA